MPMDALIFFYALAALVFIGGAMIVRALWRNDPIIVWTVAFIAFVAYLIN